jgi:hypothetical protein
MREHETELLSIAITAHIFLIIITGSKVLIIALNLKHYIM